MKISLSPKSNYFFIWAIFFVLSVFTGVNTYGNIVFFLPFLFIVLIWLIILVRLYILEFDSVQIYASKIFKKLTIPLTDVVEINHIPSLFNKGFQMHHGFTLIYLNSEGLKKKIWFFVPQSRNDILVMLEKNISEINHSSATERKKR